jgi:integrase/recombinase XerD
VSGRGTARRAPGQVERCGADFLRHLADERQLSPNTVDGVRKDLAELETFLTGTSAPPDWAGTPRWTGWRLRASWGGAQPRGSPGARWRVSCPRPGPSSASSTWRTASPPTPPGRCALPKPTAAPRPPGRVDVRAVFEVAEAAPRRTRWQGTRDLVILELLYGSGLRLSELHGLDLAALDRRVGVRCGAGQGKQGAHRSGDGGGGPGAGALRAARGGGARASTAARAPRQRPGRRLSRRSIQAACTGASRPAARAPGSRPTRSATPSPPTSWSGRRPPGGEGAPRARLALHHPDLHPHHAGAAPAGVPGGASQRGGCRATRAWGRPLRLPPGGEPRPARGRGRTRANRQKVLPLAFVDSPASRGGLAAP